MTPKRLELLRSADKAAAHVVDCSSNMDLQFSVVVVLHRPSFLAATTAALKSSISRSGLSDG